MEDWFASETTLYSSLLSDTGGYYDKAGGSCEIMKAERAPDRHELSDDVLEQIDGGYEYYEMLYKRRIRP